MDRPLVGEYMSKHTNVNSAIAGLNGDFYANHHHVLIGKPFDIGRLFYVKLATACARYSAVTDFEVTWNHRIGALLGSIEAHNEEAHAFINENEASARQQRIQIIDQTVLRLLQDLELGKCDQ